MEDFREKRSEKGGGMAGDDKGGISTEEYFV